MLFTANTSKLYTEEKKLSIFEILQSSLDKIYSCTFHNNINKIY